MTYPAPVHMGQFDAVKTGDVIDMFLDITADLLSSETIASVAFTVTDTDGATVAGVVGSHTETDTRTDFRVTAPTIGVYLLTAVFTIDDGQKLTRIADLVVV